MSDPVNLQSLHDIILPASSDWWPPAPGWFVLAGLLTVLFIRTIRLQHRRWRSGAYRRAALDELYQLKQWLTGAADPAWMLPQLPALLKRTALAAWPRNMVADLTGDAWLTFLDNTGEAAGFSRGDGRLLAILAVLPPEKLRAVAEEQIHALFQLSETWIKTHTAPPRET